MLLLYIFILIRLYFNGIYPKGNFSWHHLWFLPYLLLMSIAATPLFIYLRKENNAIVQKTKTLLEKSPLGLYLATIPLILGKTKKINYPN